MILGVAERASAARNISRTIVATDDPRIFQVVFDAGHEVVMTSPDHVCGTDRLAEVAASLDGVDFIINVQGDEPMISPKTIERVAAELARRPQAGIVSAFEAMRSAADVLNPDIVKVVIATDGRAVYFSRSAIPYPREAVRRHGNLGDALQNEPVLLSLFKKHTGIYGYRKNLLIEFAGWTASELEGYEALEQLRALDHGVNVYMVEAAEPSTGVDTLADLELARREFAARQPDL
jgi:3-deoxy-manno-octulosonate cytidylyltransferase (CMP-KDO synthetase)